MLNKDIITKLIELSKNDREQLDFIRRCLDSFEQYHRAVFDEQMFRIVYGAGAVDGDEFRESVTSLDKMRTTNHNGVIARVGILNRMAEKSGLAPIYDGIVSEDRPYRRQIANAVFEYIEDIIKNRN